MTTRQHRESITAANNGLKEMGAEVVN